MWKKIWEQLKAPKGWLIALTFAVAVVFCGFSIGSLFLHDVGIVLQCLVYLSYAVAAISLGYAVYICVRILPRVYRESKEKLREHKIFGTLIDNYGIRTVVFAGLSTAITLALAAYYVVAAVSLRSIWFAALGGYYLLLLAMRGSIVLYRGRTRGKERNAMLEVRKYRNCGIAMSATILALSVAVAQMVSSGEGFHRPGMMIYVAAAYTFYKVTMSVINFVKAKREKDFTVEALRNVNVADSAVSLLSLQTAMLEEFSSAEFHPAFVNALTGAGVCALVFGLGVYMVIYGSKTLKKKKEEEHGRQTEI